VAIDELAYARRWKTLPVLCLSLAIIMIANGSLNVALPSLARELGASASQLQWMVDAYSLVFAGLLFTAGAIGDRYGRKGTLQGGLVLFLIGAAIAVTATTPALVIAARAVMGVAAAFVMPSTLSILTTVFPPEERGQAIGLWAGIAAGAAALGPSTSGLLVQHFWWGSVFLVNVPLVVAALMAGIRLVPSSKDATRRPLDVRGAVLSIVGVGTLVYAIIEAPMHGWASRRTMLTFAAAGMALTLFARREHTARHPMLDLRLFRDRRFSVASGGIFMAFFAMFGSMFLVTQYVQLVLGYSALTAGLLFVPTSLAMMLLAPQAPKVVARFGASRTVAGGLMLAATGLGVLASAHPNGNVLLVLAALLPMVSGMALTMPPLTTLIMSTVPPGSAGVGSAVNDTTRELGGALGVAVLGSLVSTRFTSSLGPLVTGLSADLQVEASRGVSGALHVARSLPAPAGPRFASAARSAFVDGFGLAVLVAMLAVVASAAVACLLLAQRADAGPAEESWVSGVWRRPEPRTQSAPLPRPSRSARAALPLGRRVWCESSTAATADGVAAPAGHPPIPPLAGQ
jgi:EmrB/QacA subfamily drug resistance transporter